MDITAIGDAMYGIVPGFKVSVADTNKAASLTTSRPGAIPAMPTLKEVESALK